MYEFGFGGNSADPLQIHRFLIRVSLIHEAGGNVVAGKLIDITGQPSLPPESDEVRRIDDAAAEDNYRFTRAIQSQVFDAVEFPHCSGQ
ncbi:MAG: hypothetical protein C0518_04740 [Opitutus sp.]|nr:hypothetical protein [Opitutus sp.]